MICYARSGGTLLNRILGVLPNTVVISEVNPLGGGSGKELEASLVSIPAQAKGWYGYTINGETYGEQAAELAKSAQRDGKKLIIRDWPFVNFTPHPYNGNIPPQKLLSLETLSPFLKVHPFALVRDAVDVWASMGKTKSFFNYYSQYVIAITNLGIPIFKYENLCLTPEETIKKLCKTMDITYGDFSHFHKYTNVNGDSQLPLDIRRQRGRQSVIALRKRRDITKEDVTFLARCKEFHLCQSLLEYPTEVMPTMPNTSFAQAIARTIKKFF